MNTIGEISYLNSRPFYWHWKSKSFPLLPETPRRLAELARSGLIDAGPMPLSECWDMRHEFEPLGPFGIAVTKESKSVFLLSQEPFSKLNEITIGVTSESSTSVRLLRMLIERKYGHVANFRSGFDSTDQAQLVIGDKALEIFYKSVRGQWRFATDLATEWWDWKKTPFVFAQWAVRSSLPPAIKKQLEEQVSTCLVKGTASIPEIALKMKDSLYLPADNIIDYLDGFSYFFGPQEKNGIDMFYNMLSSDPVTTQHH